MRSSVPNRSLADLGIRTNLRWTLGRAGRSCLAGILLLVLLALTTSAARAQDDGVVPDRFRIAVGRYAVSRYESTMSLSNPNLGVGVSIRPADTLGLQTEQSVLRVDGHYRFTRHDALTYSWYRIASQGGKSIEKEIEWIDENGNPITIPVGANVTASLDYDIFKLGYLWSFYHSDKVELAAGGGLHITRLAIGMSASATSTGVSAKDVKTTVPLPVVSFGLTYRVTPRFMWYLKSEYFYLSFDGTEGTYADSSLGVEFRVLDHVGVGFALGGNSLSLVDRSGDYRLKFENRIAGGMLYVSGYF